jgi:hypothetical protein
MYQLIVDIDTDDDATLLYLGKKYCFYGEDLVFSKNFETHQQAKAYLQREIDVLHGGKAAAYVAEFLAECVQKLEKDVCSRHSVDGNQKMSVSIVPVALLTENERYSAYNTGLDEIARLFGIQPTQPTPMMIESWVQPGTEL